MKSTLTEPIKILIEPVERITKMQDSGQLKHEQESSSSNFQNISLPSHTDDCRVYECDLKVYGT